MAKKAAKKAETKVEKETKKAGLKVKLIPAPRHLSSDCGSCLRFLTKNRETVEGILTEKRIDYDSIHIL